MFRAFVNINGAEEVRVNVSKKWPIPKSTNFPNRNLYFLVLAASFETTQPNLTDKTRERGSSKRNNPGPIQKNLLRP